MNHNHAISHTHALAPLNGTDYGAHSHPIMPINISHDHSIAATVADSFGVVKSASRRPMGHRYIGFGEYGTTYLDGDQELVPPEDYPIAQRSLTQCPHCGGRLS